MPSGQSYGGTGQTSTGHAAGSTSASSWPEAWTRNVRQAIAPQSLGRRHLSRIESSPAARTTSMAQF